MSRARRVQMATRAGWLLGGLALALLGGPARAAEVTEVASAFDAGDPYDFNVWVGYRRTLDRGAIKREFAGGSAGGMEIVRELRYTRVRHTLEIKAEAAIWRDLAAYVTIPVVLADFRSLDFAQNGGDPCFVGGELQCVRPSNSTLVRDGLLNENRLMSPTQVAVADEKGPPGGLRLPKRSGLDQIHVGLRWAVLNQRRRAWLPTWVVGFEARVSVGDPMTYDRRAPSRNTSVGRGLHELRWSMALSRRFRYIDAWTSFHYMLPIARGDSLFARTEFPGSGQERAAPQQRGGAEVGMEIVPWEVPADGHRFTIELAAGLEGVFDGRAYTPLWELLAGHPRLEGPCVRGTARLMLWDNGTYCKDEKQTIPYPGITHVENYLVFSGRLALALQLTRFFRVRAGVSLAHEQQHFITFEDPGKATNVNGTIDPNDPRQANPLYRPLIDAPGRRFRTAESTIFDVFVSLQAML